MPLYVYQATRSILDFQFHSGDSFRARVYWSAKGLEGEKCILGNRTYLGDNSLRCSCLSCWVDVNWIRARFEIRDQVRIEVRHGKNFNVRTDWCRETVRH